jgi:multicomponent K+:H+ antiporter subunit E
VRRIVPHPFLSAFVAGFWLLLVNRPSAAHVAVALLLGLLLPLLTARFTLDVAPVARWSKALELAALFAYDILVANIAVAAYVLGLRGPIRPAFVEVPLELAREEVAALLAAMVTLTPGTVSVDIDRARRVLLVHALVSDDPGAMTRAIKSRYEARLKEIFRC